MTILSSFPIPDPGEAKNEIAEERRSSARWPVALEGSCYGTWGSSPCVITDLSESGITVSSAHIAKVGEEFTVAWYADDGYPPIQVTCAVRQFSDQQAHLEFLYASPSDRLRIRQLIRQKIARENA